MSPRDENVTLYRFGTAQDGQCHTPNTHPAGLFRRTPVLELSDEERAAGFALADVHGVRVAALAFASDLLVIKMRSSEGAIEYVICDRANLEPMVVAARDLSGLLTGRVTRAGR